MMPKPAVPAEQRAAAALKFDIATFAYEVKIFGVETELNKEYGWLGLPRERPTKRPAGIGRPSPLGSSPK